MPYDLPLQPFLKLGAYGILLLIIVLLLIFGIKLLPILIKRIDGSPVREPRAGEKSTDYWLEEFTRIEAEGNRQVIEALKEFHREQMGVLGKMRSRLRDINSGGVTELTIKIDRDMIQITKILRSIEQRLEQLER